MRTKRKSESHIIEKNSLKIIGDILPTYWTIREYKPDYGIDLSIELFEKKENKLNKVYDTLGEHLYIQVKGVEKIKTGSIKIYERNNIENEKIIEKNEFQDLKVVKYSIDTLELKTVQRMGSSLPVLLFVVDTTSKLIYFLCLNDYIDKVILPKNKDYHLKKTITLNIPESNIISKTKETLIPLYLYAKRPKYYAFFIKVGYQRNELNFIGKNLISQCKYFAEILMNQDIFSGENNWHIMSSIHSNLGKLIEKGKGPSSILKKTDDINAVWENGAFPNELYTETEMLNSMSIQALWDQMDNLKNVYETICREWFLPTSLGIKNS